MKTPEQIGRDVIESEYGIGTDWEEPNEFGEAGFTRAQAETDIDSDDIRRLIEKAIWADRAQWFDTAGSASSQHYIDTGRYLLHEEVAELGCGHNNQSMDYDNLVTCQDCGVTFLGSES